MTGRELIEWIHLNHAEDMRMIVQYRDSGGAYRGGEDVDPIFCKATGTGKPYDDDYNIEYAVKSSERNAVAL